MESRMKVVFNLRLRAAERIFILRTATEASAAKIVKPGLRSWRTLRAFLRAKEGDFSAFLLVGDGFAGMGGEEGG